MDWLLWVILAAAVLFVLLELLSYYFFKISVLRLPKNKPVKVKTNTTYDAYLERINQAKQWLLQQPCEEITTDSYDGLKLHARYYQAPGSKKTVICVHGFRSSGEFDFGSIARMYLQNGYNTLVISQRAHADSEGEYVTYGVKERFDVAAWADYLDIRFGNDTQVFFHGISLGGASVLMASGLPHRANLRAIVADCGFTDAQSEFAHVLRTGYHLPPRLILFLADGFCRRKAKFSLDDFSTLDAMKVNETPILFVHGQKDSLVPPEMSERNFEACHAPKEILRTPNSIHATSWYDENELYTKTVLEFFAKHS